MKTLKATIIILVTLIIGIVIGILAGGWMFDRKLKTFVEYRTEEGFRRIALEILDPDEKQAEELLPIIDEYARLNRELNAAYRRDLETLQLTYWGELQPYLTEVQVDRVAGTRKPYHERPARKRRDPVRNPEPSPGTEIPENTENSSDVTPVKTTPAENQNLVKTEDTVSGVQTTQDTALVEPGMEPGPILSPPPEFQPGHRQGRPMPGPIQKAEYHSLMLRNRLGLSDPQYESVRQVNIQHAMKMKAISDSYRENPRRGWIDDMSVLENARNEKMSEILTPPQYEEYQLMMRELKKTWLHKRLRG